VDFIIISSNISYSRQDIAESVYVKTAFAVVPTDKICGRSLSSKIPVDYETVCHMTNVT